MILLEEKSVNGCLPVRREFRVDTQRMNKGLYSMFVL